MKPVRSVMTGLLVGPAIAIGALAGAAQAAHAATPANHASYGPNDHGNNTTWHRDWGRPYGPPAWGYYRHHPYWRHHHPNRVHPYHPGWRHHPQYPHGGHYRPHP